MPSGGVRMTVDAALLVEIDFSKSLPIPIFRFPLPCRSPLIIFGLIKSEMKSMILVTSDFHFEEIGEIRSDHISCDDKNESTRSHNCRRIEWELKMNGYIVYI